MLGGVDSENPIDHHPLPTIVLNTETDQLVDHNDAAIRLLGTAALEVPFSQLLLSDHGRLVVFLDAVEYYGSYIDRTISLAGPDHNALRLQTYGVQCPSNRVLLSFLDLDEHERRDRQTDQDAQQRAGLTKWQSIYGFFREVEAQNHLILEAAGEGIYGINAKGQATFVNRAAQEMLGWSADDLIGKDLHAIIHHKHLNGDHFPAHKCPIYASFRNDETVRIDDDVFWRKDGKPILVEYVSTPIYDHDVLAGAVVIFRDVTERRENERKLREAMAEVEELRDKLEQENDYLLTEIRTARPHTGVVGISPSVRKLNLQIDLAAKNDANVLVTGPAGSGKNLAVSAIHEASDRSKRPLVRVNCVGLSAQELAAELFGYRRGAYRGANRDTTGKLMLAHNGTLLLDEVAELPLDFQAKLSSVLADRTFRRLGDVVDHRIDMSIIATTTHDLMEEVRAGRFRQDLFFALSVFSIACTPLNDRLEDVPYLAKHFLERTTRRLRLPPTRLSNANIAKLTSYNWPGNVRELENVIERAAILAQGGKLKFDFALERGEAALDPKHILTHAQLKELERQNLKNALRRAGGKVSGKGGAAEILGLPATTTYSKLRSFGLHLEKLDH